MDGVQLPQGYSHSVEAVYFLPLSSLKFLSPCHQRRLYTFLNNKNIIYDLQFGFRQQYSTSHTLINLTENIRKTLDDENIEYK